QFLGGPSEDAQRRWWLSLHESHLRFKIGPRERDAWMKSMIQALDDVPIDEPVRSAFRSLFERSSAYVVNTGPALREEGGEPSKDALHQEVSSRWAVQCTLDQAVAAVRSGDADRVISLAESSTLRTLFANNRSILATLLAMMIARGHETMLQYVRE